MYEANPLHRIPKEICMSQNLIRKIHLTDCFKFGSGVLRGSRSRPSSIHGGPRLRGLDPSPLPCFHRHCSRSHLPFSCSTRCPHKKIVESPETVRIHLTEMTFLTLFHQLFASRESVCRSTYLLRHSPGHPAVCSMVFSICVCMLSFRKT